MNNTPTVPRAHHSNAPQGTERSYILTVCVEDRPGSVDRVVGLFRRRRSKLQSLSMRFTQEGQMHITAEVKDAEVVFEHLVEQLRKIIDVRQIERLEEEQSLVREVALVRVQATSTNSQEIIDTGREYGAQVAHQTASTITFEVASSPERVERMLEALCPYGIQKLTRSGCVGLAHPDHES